MKSDASNIVAKFIESHEGLFEIFVNIYIFGSILDKNRISKDSKTHYNQRIFQKYNSPRIDRKPISNLLFCSRERRYVPKQRTFG